MCQIRINGIFSLLFTCVCGIFVVPLRRMAKKISDDSTLMSKDEFFARIEEAEREIAEGKGTSFDNKAEMNAWLNTL